MYGNVLWVCNTGLSHDWFNAVLGVNDELTEEECPTLSECGTN